MYEKKYALESIKFYIDRLQSLYELLQDENNDLKAEIEAAREVQYTADNLRKEMQRRLLKQKNWERGN